jgi:hypothetical protein
MAPYGADFRRSAGSDRKAQSKSCGASAPVFLEKVDDRSDAEVGRIFEAIYLSVFEN